MNNFPSNNNSFIGNFTRIGDQSFISGFNLGRDGNVVNIINVGNANFPFNTATVTTTNNHINGTQIFTCISSVSSVSCGTQDRVSHTYPDKTIGDINVRNQPVSLIGCTGQSINNRDGNNAIQKSTISGSVMSRDGNNTIQGSTISGSVMSRDGSNTIQGSTISGSVNARRGTIELENTVIKGTLTSALNKIIIGCGNTINKLVISSGSQSLISNTVINSVPSGIISSTSRTELTQKPDTQYVVLGAGTTLEDLEFDAQLCQLTLKDNAKYNGAANANLKIVRE